MPARLFCKTGQLAGSTYEIGEQAQIGKNPGNTIQLSPAVISGRHAKIYFDPQKQSYYIEDLNSRNGTRVDGSRLRGKERLDQLNVITFANSFDFIFQVVGAGASSHARASKVDSRTSVQQEGSVSPSIQSGGSKTVIDDGALPTPRVTAGKGTSDPGKTTIDDGAIPTPSVTSGKGATDPGQKTTFGDEPMEVPSFEARGAGTGKDPGKTSIDDGAFAPPPIEPKAAPRRSVFVLEVKDPSGGVNVFTLKEGESIVGRLSSCDIPIDDPSVSRQHAVFHLTGGALSVKDLGSKNSTFVDSRKISTEVTLSTKSKVRFGLVEGVIVTREQ